MKVLLLGISPTDPNFLSWQAALQREGVPFDTLIASTGHTPITSATLSGTSSDGTQEAKYEAVIVSIAGLPICTTTCVSGLAQSEWNALEGYEQTFAIREIDGDAFPSATYGLNAPTTSGTLDGTTGTLTADGATTFSYLKGSVLLGNYPADSTGNTTYGYEATPVSTTSFDTLVTGPNSSALVGIYTDPNGVQRMIETYAQNSTLMQAELLQHGATNWVTRGVYFGDQRNYLETNIDDNLLADDSWDTTAHTTDYDPSAAIREQGSDIVNAAKWEDANNFRIDELFNGGGSVAFASGCTIASGGGSGTSEGCNPTAPGTDPLLAQLQTTCTSNCGPANAGAGKTYAGSFGWVNHTWDHPNLDEGCATTNYIEAQIQNNTNWAASAPGTTLGLPTATSGGLGLTEDSTGATALGAQNPGVLVTGEHSGLANLLPGNPGIVDPPAWDDATVSTTGGTLAAGTYTYAITDQFSSGGGESSASETQVTLSAPGSVALSWQAVCHAADFKIYRATGPETAPTGWTLLTTIDAPAWNGTANSWFADPTSTTLVGNGGAQQLSYTDTGAAGTSASAPSTTANNATESAYQQNTDLATAFSAIGLKAFGSDSSKPYPNPATSTFTTGSPPSTQFAAGQTFTDGGAQAEGRYPTNIYYNVSTEAQELDEYNTLYQSAPSGICQNSSTTTCESSPATFAQVIASVDQNMFAHIMGNDPRPDYFHQSNMMGTPPAGSEAGPGDMPPATWTPPATAPATGDGLYYSTMDPLLYEYNQYFNVPLEQPTTMQIADLLAQQSAWAQNASVSGYIEGNQVTVTNGATAAAEIPLTGITTVGSAYGGTTSGWTSAPAGTSTYTSSTTWPTAGIQVNQAPQGSWINTLGSGGYLLAGWDGAQDVSDLPTVSATLSQGSPTQWAQGTSDVRALQAPDGSTVRNAAAYTDPTAVSVKLGFTNAYSGTISVYALDWNNEGDQESISVDDGSGPKTVSLTSGFSNGDWVTFPANVVAGATVTITATKTGGTDAELSAIMLGGAGAPPATGGQQLSQGGWVGSLGSAGYDLAAWYGSSDLTAIPSASVTVVHGSRYVWAADTTDARALSNSAQTVRNSATYYDPNQIELQLTFSAAYTGQLSLYGVDWDAGGRRELITVNGQTDSLSADFSQGAWVSFPITAAAGATVTITVDRTAGGNAVLSGIFLGGAGAPPSAPPDAVQSPQGSWVGTYGVAGYVLAGWDNGLDSASTPGVTETVTQGSRYQWAANTTDVRALANAAGTARDAATYYDPNEISIQLTFTNAFNGNLELYAVDWDNAGRQETATVNGVTASVGTSFTNGAWLTFPIVVGANGTVTITVDRVAGPNAVLSGIFIGGAGAPPAGPPVPTQSPQGNWVGTYGAAGYALAGWNNGYDLTATPGVTETLAQGSTYVWASNTSDARALANPAGTVRNAATYYDANQIVVQLTFSTAWTGNLHLYAVDWDSAGRRETITVNGVTANLSGDFSQGAWVAFPINVAANSGVTITVDNVGGPNAVLSGIFFGDAGTPPVAPVNPSQSPQGNWVGTYGSSGYDLAAFNGGSDLASMPNASVSLVQGSSYLWAADQPITSDTQALADPTGASRTAATWYDPNQIKLTLTFPNAFTGNLELYAVDWDSTARRETITVGDQSADLYSDFSQGAWAVFPISVAAGGTVTVTVDRVAGANAVLSGLFLS